MGPSTASLVVAALGIMVLLVSGWWTNRAYARFDQLPGHYDWRGRATRMEKRSVMAWLLPVVFSITIVAIAALQMLLPPEMHNSDPSTPLFLLPCLLIGAQALVLRLLSRWAKTQG